VPIAQQQPLPNAEIVGGEVLWHYPIASLPLRQAKSASNTSSEIDKERAHHETINVASTIARSTKELYGGRKK
jgi:hypothetical protein